MGKTSFTSAQGCATEKESSYQAHLSEKSTQVFISNASLPLTLIEQVWVHDLHDWLIWKEDIFGKGP
jgi:hypothetical protein